MVACETALGIRGAHRVPTVARGPRRPRLHPPDDMVLTFSLPKFLLSEL